MVYVKVHVKAAEFAKRNMEGLLKSEEQGAFRARVETLMNEATTLASLMSSGSAGARTSSIPGA